MSEQRNVIIAIALSVTFFAVWTMLFPPAERDVVDETTVEETALGSNLLPGAQTAVGTLPRDEALKQNARVNIDAPRVWGSINLTGARLDDLHLRDYHETTDPSSPTITLLSPRRFEQAYYAEYGWIPAQGSGTTVPDPSTVWTAEQGSRLAPNAPVTLKWENGQGLTFRITYNIDENYMFQVDQSVENQTGGDVALTPYGVIGRHNVPDTQELWFSHVGFVGVLEGSLKNRKWKKMRKDGPVSFTSEDGWLGFTDKYWMTAMAPPQGEAFTANGGIDQTQGTERFAAVYQMQPRIISAGGNTSIETKFFAGAKEVSVVDAYEHSEGIKRFDLAIDWGWIRFLTKPLFFLLNMFASFFADMGIEANFGIAIILATLCIKLMFFPLANGSFVMMSKMKLVQPRMKEIQETYKNDKTELQKHMMELYKKEKINPLAGCLPLFIQIPVFLSFYQVLYATIEMRHEPFFGWVDDLSARDPTTVFNLFGLLPFDVPTFLMIGAWPILMGISMFLQMSLNPPPQDATQRMMFAWMPLVITVMLAPFAVGLVIYWTANNLLTMMQQMIIMKRMGTPIELGRTLKLDKIAKLISGKKEAPAHTSGDDAPKSGS